MNHPLATEDHFYGLYRACPRKFYLRYVLGWRPTQTSPPLLFGSAMHEAQEQYYLNDFSLRSALERFAEEIHKVEKSYEDGEIFARDVADGPIMLKEWHRTWGEYDNKTYELIGTEVPYEFQIGPEGEFLFTVRLDTIFRHKTTGRYVVKDLKTTRWSDIKTFTSVDYEDQMTSYLWALGKTNPDWEVETAIPDIIYKRQSVVRASRPGQIYRSKYALAQFELGMFGTIGEVTQKVLQLENDPPEILFWRDGGQCAKFGCEYVDICRSHASADRVPIGFSRDDWTEVETLKDIKQLEGFEKWTVKEKEKSSS